MPKLLTGGRLADNLRKFHFVIAYPQISERDTSSTEAMNGQNAGRLDSRLTK